LEVGFRFLDSFEIVKMQSYTVKDVACHNKKTDCWIIYEGKVLDVTKFLDQHPGGEEVLLDAAGRDATRDFKDVGHSDEAKKMMEGYQIGIIKSSETAGSSVVSSSNNIDKGNASSNSNAKKNTPDSSGGGLPVGSLAIAAAFLAIALLGFALFKL